VAGLAGAPRQLVVERSSLRGEGSRTVARCYCGGPPRGRCGGQVTQRWRERAARVGLSLVGVVAALLGTETLLRTFPRLLPSGAYGAGVYAAALNTNVQGATSIYNKVRFVERRPNDRGFLDASQQRAKPPGVYPIGFFGDSYVEASQVELADAFFRRLPSTLNRQTIEAQAFGISGWGTLHALCAYDKFAPLFALDAACYIFVENDPGDNDFRLGNFWRQGAAKPLAELSDEPPGYVVHPAPDPAHQSLLRKALKALQYRSLLAQVVLTRIELLRTEGIRVRAAQGRGEMGESRAPVPNSNDLPSTWPREDRERAGEFTRRILAHWRYFFVLYVPRGEVQLTGRDYLDDGWRPWLRTTCEELGVPLLDQSEALAARLGQGSAVYDDHWSPAGHEVIAAELARHIEGVLAGRTP